MADIPESTKSIPDRLAGAVSEDAIRHLMIRSPLNQAIYKVLREHDMSNMSFADDPAIPYPLVDLMSNPAPADIGTGEMEMVALADEIESAVLSTRAATPAMDREAVARIIDPFSFCDVPYTDDPALIDVIKTWQDAALTKADAILSTLSADAIRQGEGSRGPNGVASAQVETIATAVMRWGAPHFKHMVAFSTLCEAIGHSVDATFADTNGGLRQALDALRAERAKPVQGPEHGAWDRGRRYGLDDAIRIVASLEGCPATPASHASDGGKA